MPQYISRIKRIMPQYISRIRRIMPQYISRSHKNNAAILINYTYAATLSKNHTYAAIYISRIIIIMPQHYPRIILMPQYIFQES